MNFTSQICTTETQSKRLVALGLKAETADMRYHIRYLDLGGILKECTPTLEPYPPLNNDRFIPAWSLNRLIEMMPQGIQDCSYRCFALAVNSEGVSYEYHYIDEEGKGYNDSIGCTDLFDSLYDDIIAHIEWLIKEGDFNKEFLE